MRRLVKSSSTQGNRFIVDERDLRVVIARRQRESPAALALWALLLCLLIALLTAYDWR